jgi:magnesium chelatase accessory protein
MKVMADTLVWQCDGRDWPLREASRFVYAAGITWHVQDIGDGAVLLLLHGTGASTHSWRALVPIFAEHFRVIAIDLPGHGFTQFPPREFLSPRGMGIAINALLHKLGVSPAIVLSHSAGAAVAVQMCVDGHIAPRLLVGVNAALLPLPGRASHLFSPLAKLVVRLPLVPRLLARFASDRSVIDAMIDDTGSKLDRAGVDFYWRMAQSPTHVAAAFGMMAEWDLPELERVLGKLRIPLILLAATNDKAIRPADADRVRAILPQTKVIALANLGHLAHEEAPQLVADIVIDATVEAGVIERRA